MNKQPGKLVGQPLNGAMIFDTPEQFFDALLGPAQHDAHVTGRRQVMKFAAWKAEAAALDAAMAAHVADMIARERARRPQ